MANWLMDSNSQKLIPITAPFWIKVAAVSALTVLHVNGAERLAAMP